MHLRVPDERFNQGRYACSDRTSIAAVSWDSGRQIRLYVQNEYEGVQEIAFQNNTWNMATNLGACNVHTQIAAIVIGEGEEIDVFYQETNGTDVVGIQQQWSLETGTWTQSKSDLVLDINKPGTRTRISFADNRKHL
jgi:hypothetical protein